MLISYIVCPQYCNYTVTPCSSMHFILPYFYALCLAIDDSEIILPNGTVPLNRTNPSSIIMDLPTPPQLFGYV